jgi:cytochrome b561
MEKYSKTAVALHWLIALGIAFNMAMLFMGDDARPRWYINMHKSLGIVLLLLVIGRILWRYMNTPPALPEYKRWEVVLSKATHHLLYILMIFMPLSGWLMNSASFNTSTGQAYGIDIFHVIPWFNIPLFSNMSEQTREAWHFGLGAAHGFSTQIVLLLLLALHIGGALKHQFLDKEKQFQRMWF